MVAFKDSYPDTQYILRDSIIRKLISISMFPLKNKS